MPGTVHRPLELADLLDYRDERAARLAAVEQMVEASEGLGETY